MIGTTLDRRLVRVKRFILKNTGKDRYGQDRTPCICSSKDLYTNSTVCPRHQITIKNAQKRKG